MAGNYMDAPATRLAYDRDGSVGVLVTLAGQITQLTGSQLRALNGETEAAITPSNHTILALVFPIPVDLSAVFFATQPSSPLWTLETSLDTTTGLDGTWVAQGAALTAIQDTKPNYRIATALRNAVPGVDSTGIRGVRMRAASSTSIPIRSFHVYANPSATATVDRLALWHPTLDEPAPPAYFDWGNVARSSSADRDFRIKNLSPDLTAEDVVIFADAITPGLPSVASMHTFSDNAGATFLTSITVDSIAPGAISDVLTVRRVVPSNAQVSVWSARIAADVTTWTEV